jgi:hypothetical protein
MEMFYVLETSKYLQMLFPSVTNLGKRLLLTDTSSYLMTLIGKPSHLLNRYMKTSNIQAEQQEILLFETLIRNKALTIIIFLK